MQPARTQVSECSIEHEAANRHRPQGVPMSPGSQQCRTAAASRRMGAMAVRALQRHGWTLGTGYCTS